jgi:hypothetical protein
LVLAIFFATGRASAQSDVASTDGGVAESGTVASGGGDPSAADGGAAPVEQDSGLSIVPPHLSSPGAVEYPRGGHGEALVVLLLTIAADGSVTSAQPIEGEEPFASTAAEAARDWLFEPALRNGQPIAAKIRFEVTFHPPSEPELTAPDVSLLPDVTAPAAPPIAASPPPEKPVEVTVRGERPPPQASTLGRAEVRQLPGAFGDPFRAIEVLPGVTPIVSGLPFFYVRGAPPGNIGYFLDGVRVPYLFHVGLGPAVIHPGLVDRVDLYAGGYPAPLGRFAGGIVAAETTAPRSDLHGEGNVRIFDLGALAETGFAGGRGTVLVAGRYSYTAAILSLIAKDTKLDYRDYEARVTYDVSPDDRVTLFSFGAYDLLAQRQNGLDTVLFGSEFYRFDTRYDHRFGASTRVRLGLTLGIDQTKIPEQPRNARDRMTAARVDLSHDLSDEVSVRVGGDATLDAYRADVRPYADPEDPDTQLFNSLFPPRDDLALGAYAQLAYHSAAVEVTPGVRVDLYRSGGASAVGIDPRISSRLRLADKVHVIHAFGIAHQPPSFLIPVPGLAIGQLRGGLQTSIQSSAGVEVDLPEATTATVNVFDNVFLHMSDTLGISQRDAGNGVLEQRSLGSAIGAEVYVRRKLTRRLGGFLSYTLSRSTRSVGNEHFPASFDRTHVLNAALAFDLGRNWRAGTRFTFYSGVPFVPSSNGLVPPPRDPSPPRDPPFYRFDLRFEKRWVYSPTAWLAFVAEFLNATLHKEVILGQSIGPVAIPSFGLEGSF